MTRFDIHHNTEHSDRIFVEVDKRFEVLIIRSKSELKLLVFPRTNDELWDEPCAAFSIDEQEIIALERELA